MNQLCRVCGEVAAGFHFGAFTCEGCKSFFGRACNNPSSVGECKTGNQCVITRKNRTACKSCRLRKCLSVGMSKNGSRYGRRSNWFKIHCLLQDRNPSIPQSSLSEATRLLKEIQKTKRTAVDDEETTEEYGDSLIAGNQHPLEDENPAQSDSAVKREKGPSPLPQNPVEDNSAQNKSLGTETLPFFAAAISPLLFSASIQGFFTPPSAVSQMAGLSQYNPLYNLIANRYLGGIQGPSYSNQVEPSSELITQNIFHNGVNSIPITKLTGKECQRTGLPINLSTKHNEPDSEDRLSPNQPESLSVRKINHTNCRKRTLSLQEDDHSNKRSRVESKDFKNNQSHCQCTSKYSDQNYPIDLSTKQTLNDERNNSNIDAPPIVACAMRVTALPPLKQIPNSLVKSSNITKNVL